MDVSSATAWVAPDLIKALVSLSDKTVKRSAVDQVDLNYHPGNQKKDHISLADQQFYYLQVVQRLY